MPSIVEFIMRTLAGDADYARFCEIMRMMDDRYHGLDLATLKKWFEQKRRVERVGHVVGCFLDDGCSLDGLFLATAYSVKVNDADPPDESTPRPPQDLLVHKIGVDYRRLNVVEWGSEQLERIYGCYVRMMAQVAGVEVGFRAMRPKSMTWKPVQHMHDCVEQGVLVPAGVADESFAYQMVVDEARDRGDAVLWHLRITKCPCSPAAMCKDTALAR